MRSSIFYICIFSFWATYGNAQYSINNVQQQIATWQTTPGLSNASICISVSDNQTNEKLIETDPQLSLIPASILKTITTATALEVLGPDFRFKTTLNYSGFVRNDTLFGNLQIVGGGDPTLGSKYFPDRETFMDEWIKALQDKQIKVITGNLILDGTIYESQMVPGTWIWEDLGNYFGAGAAGISAYDNMYEIHLKSEREAGKPTQIIRIVPEIPNLELTNEVVSSDSNSDEAYVFGNPEENKRIIRGTIPKNRADFVVKASVPNPAALLAGEFMKKFSSCGISISGKPKFEKANVESNPLSVIESPPLRDIIRLTNHESVNLFAEHFLKHLALQKNGLGTTKDGCKFVMQFWKDKGLDVTGLYMNDGSGLSRFNAIIADQMVDILNYMKVKSLYSNDFYKSLPSAGSGTLTSFSKENFPDDCLHAKSGSMTRVRCYAGYLTTITGRQLSFTVMLNNFSCTVSEATQQIEKLLIELRKL